MMFTGWTTPLELLKAELNQREYEGYPVPDSIRERASTLDPEHDSMNIRAIDPLFDELAALPKASDFRYSQPNDLDASGLNSSLVAPLNDTIKPKVFGFEEVAMAELAARTLSVHRKIAGLS